MLARALSAYIVSLAYETDVVLIDHDTVEKRNSPSDLGVPQEIGNAKVDVVARVYESAGIPVTKRPMRLTEKSVWMLKGSTVIVGALDNVETRLLLHNYAMENDIPYLDLGLSFTGGLVAWSSGEVSTMPFANAQNYKVDEEKKPACELIGTRVFSAAVCEGAAISLFVYLSAHDPIGIVTSLTGNMAKGGDMVNWIVLVDGYRINSIAQYVGNDRGE